MILKEEIARKEDVIGKQSKATLIVNSLLRDGQASVDADGNLTLLNQGPSNYIGNMEME